MAHLQRFQSQASTRAMAGLLSAVLHVCLLMLVLWSGGREEGIREVQAPESRLVWLDAVADRREDAGRAPPTYPASDEIRPDPPALHEPVPPRVPPPELSLSPDLVAATPELHVDSALEPHPDTGAAADAMPTGAREGGSTLVMPRAQAEELLRRIEQLAGQWVTSPSEQVTWEQDGSLYAAELVLQPSRDGVQPDRAVAEISAQVQGRQLRTWIRLKRLPFSHFAQVIDRWDPLVQLHDDEVTGRMHVNSRFNLLYDSQASPRMLGKVTTAAAGFTVKHSGRRRDSDVFTQGVETGTRRIPFSGQGWSFEASGQSAGARVHRLEDDTWIRFLGDGGYSWREGRSGPWQHAATPSGQQVHFMAEQGASVHLQGIVSGKILVYSSRRIVVEGDLTYARDPRVDAASGDLLGLVSDRDIEVAPPAVTGPGDLHIQAALFARRRIVVRETEHRDAATLHIFGSVSAGTLSESEPRYATRVEFDGRFEQLRPPGFPSTNRFAAEDWDRQWTRLPGEPDPAGQ